MRRRDTAMLSVHICVHTLFVMQRKKNLLFPPFPLKLTVCLFDEMTESYCRCPPLTSKVSLFITWLIREFHVDSGSWGSRTGQESSCKSTPARTVGCWTFSFVCDADNMSVIQFQEKKKKQLSLLICVIWRNCQMLWTNSKRSWCFYNLLYGINDIKNMEDNHTEIKAMEYIVCAYASIQLLCDVWSAFVFHDKLCKHKGLLMHLHMLFPLVPGLYSKRN